MVLLFLLSVNILNYKIHTLCKYWWDTEALGIEGNVDLAYATLWIFEEQGSFSLSDCQ